jgi:hypothetical protein
MQIFKSLFFYFNKMQIKTDELDFKYLKTMILNLKKNFQLIILKM